jgi:hypothetical protein
MFDLLQRKFNSGKVPFMERLESANEKTIIQQRYAGIDAILRIF